MVTHPLPGLSDSAPISSIEQLEEFFRVAEKPPAEFRIGAEAEKFGVVADAGAALPYEGERSVLAVLERLTERGWRPVAERDGGPIIALGRQAASITLEPGGQLELSGAPHADVHAVARELEAHYEELAEVSGPLGLHWLSLGFHPLASLEQLSWVPKERYAVMKRYLPTRGARGRDMMQRTATVQANFDFSSEQDALRKLRVLSALSPVVQALCACSPFLEGRVSPLLSQRLDVWQNMDPHRSGVVPNLWQDRELSYRDYVEWALDAGMFFFKREGEIVANTGQSFRDFWQSGFQGHRPTEADWAWHLGTLFPEVRLKRTLEVRCCDALPRDLLPAVPALLAGAVYDDASLAAVESQVWGLSLAEVQAACARVPGEGLRAPLAGKPLREWGEWLLDQARAGLTRRGRLDESGADEGRYLEPLSRLLARGLTPAQAMLGSAAPGSAIGLPELESADVLQSPVGSGLVASRD